MVSSLCNPHMTAYSVVLILFKNVTLLTMAPKCMSKRHLEILKL